jgi:hypothetical protein
MPSNPRNLEEILAGKVQKAKRGGMSGSGGTHAEWTCNLRGRT